MKRRKFVLLAAAGATAAGVPAWYFLSGEPEVDAALPKPTALEQIWDTETISAIGKRYCEQFPAESRVRRLVHLLEEDAAARAAGQPAFSSQQIQQEFVQGNTVMVDGWVLSRTEARQCALHYLTQQS